MTPQAAAKSAEKRDRSEDLGSLPRWDLTHLYPARESKELEADLARATKLAKTLRDRHQGKVAALDGDGLAGMIRDYEAVDEVLARLMTYASLIYAEDTGDPANGRFYQGMQEKVTAISSNLLFVTLEINRLDEADFKARLKSPALSHYGPWLRDVRAFRDHQLSDDLERLLHEKRVAGAGAWVRLFDETMAALRFPIGGRDLAAAEALNLLSNRDPAKRREAAVSIGRVLNDNVRLFTHITNTLAKDKQIEDGWRDFPKPWSARNLANHVEDGVVDALTDSVRAAYPDLSHRYYAMKARWMGGDRLDYWDRNAPLPEDADRVIPWPEARGIVLDAYGRFSPRLADIGKRFFDENWIDAPTRPGKSPGAFAHPSVPSVHPYILLNYLGKARDVMTLAHELGHGVHQVLAAEQGHLMSDTPLTLAETASVFGEMLTFRSLLDAEGDPAKRKILLAGKVEDMLNTVVRQIAFYEFERRVHTARAEGEVSAENLGDLWMAAQTESLGPALRFDDAYRVFWSYIPHFVHSPFYVYAYAFGDCLVNSLYAVYRDAEAGFADKYLDMLKAGGTRRHRDLLAPFGLDATDPAFWQKGLGVIRGLIDELEAADKAG
ncbi:MAG: M3 family oligoendopeptidase [Inquilinaceae bacterium]